MLARKSEFKNQIEKSENKIIAIVASRYAISAIHFDELYKVGLNQWDIIKSRVPEKKLPTLGSWWVQQTILEYTLKSTKHNKIE